MRVGQAVYMGGGEAHTVAGIGGIEADVKHALAARCAGPYWIVGEGTRPAGNSDF